jgi:hypothetical protein
MTSKNNKIRNQKGGNDNKTLAITNSPSGDSGDSDSLKKTLPLPIKRIPYDVKIFSFLCILGILVRIIFARTANEYATATVYGYGFSILALLGLLVGSFAISYKDQFSQGIMGFFKVIFKNAIPVLLIISIIAMILFQNVSFYDQINKGKVADEYYQFSGVSSFLILIQACLVINYLMDTLGGEQNTGNKGGVMTALASEMNSIIIILSVANIGIIGVLQIILKYFSTDG